MSLPTPASRSVRRTVRGTIAIVTGTLTYLCASLILTSPANAVNAVPDSSGVVAALTSNDGTLLQSGTGAGAGALCAGGSGVAFSADASTAYLADSENSAIAVCDIGSAALLDSIALTGTPADVAVTPDGSTLYVAASNGLFSIDLATNVVTATSVTAAVNSIVLSADGTRAYLASAQSVIAYNTVMDTAGLPIALTVTAAKLLISPDSSTVYVLAVGPGGVIAKIDVTAPLPSPVYSAAIGVFPFDFAITPDGSTLYVADFNFGTAAYLQVVATSTLLAGTSIPAGGGQRSVAVSPDGKSVAVFAPNSNNWLLIDTATAAVAATYPSGGTYGVAAFLPDVAPEAAFTASGLVPQSATAFDASSSITPSGEIATYSWDFGDGHSSITTTPTVSHTYAAPGSYTVSLQEATTAGTTVGTPSRYLGRSALITGRPTAKIENLIVISAVTPLTASAPADVTVTAGQDANFTSTSTGGIPTPTVQWERSTDSGMSWTSIPDATATTLTMPAVSLDSNGWQVRAVFTNDGGTITSSPATLTVKAVVTTTMSPSLTSPPAEASLASTGSRVGSIVTAALLLLGAGAALVLAGTSNAIRR